MDFQSSLRQFLNVRLAGEKSIPGVVYSLLEHYFAHNYKKYYSLSYISDSLFQGGKRSVELVSSDDDIQGSKKVNSSVS